MKKVEIEFLFEGVIFSSNVLISGLSKSLDRIEFSISFLSNYLITKYSEGYFFVLENNQFKHVYCRDEKEKELITSIQKALLNIRKSIEEFFFPV